MTKREKETRQWISRISTIQTGLATNMERTIGGKPVIFVNPEWCEIVAHELSNLIDWLIELDHEEMKDE